VHYLGKRFDSPTLLADLRGAVMLRGFLLVTYCGLASCLQAGNIFFPSRGRNRLGIHPATRHLTVMLASADDSSSSDPREATSHTNPSSPSAEIQGTKKAAGFPILSLQVLLMGVIFGQAANGLSTVVPLFLEATEASRSSFALPIVLNLGLMGWASLELGKNFGFLGKVRFDLRNDTWHWLLFTALA